LHSVFFFGVWQCEEEEVCASRSHLQVSFSVEAMVGIEEEARLSELVTV
jgi:hypothetical protein